MTEDAVSHALLSERLKRLLRRAGLLSARALAQIDAKSLSETLSVPLMDAEEFRRELDAVYATPPPAPSAGPSWEATGGGRGAGTTALDLLDAASATGVGSRRIATMSRDLDALLGGGIATGEITELCGVPGVGKTQLCMQLCVCASMPLEMGGAEGGAVYIDTEGSLMPLRMAQMAAAQHTFLRDRAARRTAMPHLAAKVASWCAASAVLGRVHVMRCTDLVSQMAAVLSMPAFLDAHAGIRLIVVDSMAFHYRHNPVGVAAGEGDMAARSRQLQLMVQALHAAATTHNCAVLVVNHVTTKMTGADGADTGGSAGGGGSGGSALGSVPAALLQEGALPDGTLIAALPPTEAAAAVAAGGARLMPALGEVWAHACTNRLMIGWNADGRHRVAQLIKSPSRQPGLAPFAITDAGVRTHKDVRDGDVVDEMRHGGVEGVTSDRAAGVGAKRSAGAGGSDASSAGSTPTFADSPAPPAQRRRVGDVWDAGLHATTPSAATGGAGLGLRVSPPSLDSGGGDARR